VILDADKHETEDFWSKARQEVSIDQNIINLNSGSCGPCLKNVHTKLTSLRSSMASRPIQYLWDDCLVGIEKSRSALAEFFNCNPNNLLMLPNVTTACAIVINSLNLPKGSEVLVSNQEYHHILHHINMVAASRGWLVKQFHIPTPIEAADFTEDDLMQIIDQNSNLNTKVIFASHVTSETGCKLPITKICEWATKNNVLSIIDGAHAPGATEIDFEKIRPDYYFANFHKWFLGAIGSGFLFVGEQHKKTLRPLFANKFWPLIEKNRDRLINHKIMPNGPTHLQYGLEYSGVVDRGPQAVVHHAVGFRLEFGDLKLRNRQLKLRDFAECEMQKLGFKTLSHSVVSLKSNLISFKIPHVSSYNLLKFLREAHHLEVQVTETTHNYSVLRVAPAFFNTEAEILHAAKILAKVDWKLFEK